MDRPDAPVYWSASRYTACGCNPGRSDMCLAIHSGGPPNCHSRTTTRIPSKPAHCAEFPAPNECSLTTPPGPFISMRKYPSPKLEYWLHGRQTLAKTTCDALLGIGRTKSKAAPK